MRETKSRAVEPEGSAIRNTSPTTSSGLEFWSLPSIKERLHTQSEKRKGSKIPTPYQIFGQDRHSIDGTAFGAPRAATTNNRPPSRSRLGPTDDPQQTGDEFTKGETTGVLKEYQGNLGDERMMGPFPVHYGPPDFNLSVDGADEAKGDGRG